MSGERGSTSSLELLVTFYCTSDGSSETRNLVLSPPPSKIEDVKNYIQVKESIPKCLQKLTLKDHELSNSQSLAGLYIRSEDSVTCTYLARADVELLGQFIHSSLHPVLTRLQTDARNLSQFQPEKDVKMLLHHCELAFHSVSYSHLLPWASVTSEANRQFLIQEGGIDRTIQLYALLLQVPWVERHPLLQRLELSCLMLLWNFAETASARQLVVEKGGFPMMLQSLMHYSREEFLEKYRTYDIFDTAVGCVSNYSELECCQLPLVQNKLAIDRLLHFAVHGPGLNIFTKMLIANCFFRLTHSSNTHKHLTETRVVRQLLEFYNRHQGGPGYKPIIAMRYTVCMALARLLLFSFATFPEEHKMKTAEILSHFLSVAKARDITQLEEKYIYNWITMLPFIEMLYTPVLCDKLRSSTTDGSPVAEGSQRWSGPPVGEDSQQWSVRLAVVALEAEMGRKCNRELTVRQGLLDFIVCLPWGVPQCENVVHLFARDRKLPVPKLASIAKAKLARCGSRLRDVLH